MSIEFDTELILDTEEVDPKLFNDVMIYGTDWTSETINTQIGKGNIILNPKFQRRIAWKEDRKSQFIESLIFGVPVPQVILTQLDSGKYIILDGKQRLTTIRDFFDNKFKLQNITLDTSINGMNSTDLESKKNDYYTHLTNRPIRTTVIRNCKHESILHQIFLRVNTGSVPLSPQELRQALHPGPFIDFANEFTEESGPLQKMLGIDAPDYRMRDVDIFVRAMSFSFFSKDYTGNMSSFLDNSCERLNKFWPTQEEKIKEAAKQFNEAIEFTQNVFEEGAFRVWTSRGYNRTVNRAVVDIMVYYFMIKEERDILDKFKNDLVAAYKDVSNNADFAKAVGFSTNSSSAVQKRFELWGEKLNLMHPSNPVTIPFK